jgi:predicted DCC family thiol-disulfide oxidoreductase YuxK
MDTTLVYDDDCGFCTWWAELFADRTGFRTVGFSDLPPDLRDRLPEDYEACSHLVTDETVYSCGASVEEAVARSDLVPEARSTVDFLRAFDDYERLRERAYRWVADNRDLLGFVVSS